VVDNRGGGGGVIAAETAVRAQPDGYTLILVTASYTANAAMHKLGYDPVHDVTPVAFVGEGGNYPTSRSASPPMAWNPPAARRSVCAKYSGVTWRSGRAWLNRLASNRQIDHT
jgi:hypothetical protein